MMRVSESYVKNRAVDIIISINKPRQALVAQRYLHLLINKIGDRSTELHWIYQVRDMLEIRLRQLGG